jgi:tetratricopeptide (TPR) repeat protein
MSDGRPVTVQELAELAIHLSDEGISLQNKNRHDQAVVRYTQSLSVFQSLNTPNESWVSFLLQNIGRLKAHRQQLAQGLAMIESAGYVEQRIGQTEEVANILREVGQSAAEFKAYALAKIWFQKTAVMYRALGLERSFEALKQQVQAIHPDPAQAQAFVPDRPHQFEINVFGRSQKRCVVTPDGAVEWRIVGELSQPTALGLDGWDLICLDRF